MDTIRSSCHRPLPPHCCLLMARGFCENLLAVAVLEESLGVREPRKAVANAYFVSNACIDRNPHYEKLRKRWRVLDKVMVRF